MSLANDIDDRTIKQQLEDLNVEIVRNRPTISGVKWATRSKKTKPIKRAPKKPYINLSRHCLYFNVTATKLLDPAGKRFEFGAADYTQRGKTVKVLLLREVEKGYKLTTKKGDCRYAQIHVPGLRHQLVSQGLQYGKYELVRVNDGWMGVPM